MDFLEPLNGRIYTQFDRLEQLWGSKMGDLIFNWTFQSPQMGYIRKIQILNSLIYEEIC
jgi:hypothetical protein